MRKPPKKTIFAATLILSFSLILPASANGNIEHRTVCGVLHTGFNGKEASTDFAIGSTRRQPGTTCSQNIGIRLYALTTPISGTTRYTSTNYVSVNAYKTVYNRWGKHYYGSGQSFNS